MIFYNARSKDIQNLALDSMTLLAEWNQLENETNRILLKNQPINGTEIPLFLTEWVDNFKKISISLEELKSNSEIKRWEDIDARLNGVTGVWRFTEVQLNNANYSLKEIIKTGLGERVMVNGFLHTMYKLRMSKELTADEIFLLDETIYVLESLDEAASEFDILLNSIVLDLKAQTLNYLQRIRVMIWAIFCTIIFIITSTFFIYKQQRRTQENKKLYQKEEKRKLLKNICINSNDENVTLLKTMIPSLNIHISTERPIIPILLQIDDYLDFSNKYNIKEQQVIIDKIIYGTNKELLNSMFAFDSFMLTDDIIIYLTNPNNPENYDKIFLFMEKLHRTILNNSELSISFTFGDINTEILDLDHDIIALRKIADYRYLLGRGSFIYAGSVSLTNNQDFQYPIEKERKLEEALNSLDLQKSMDILNDIITNGIEYGPQNMRRLILRLSAFISSQVEFLERTHHIINIEDVVPVIFQIQKAENIEEISQILKDIIFQLINNCKHKNEEKHDVTVLEIKKIIEENFADFNLSANGIADNFNLTASYINRLFKQHTLHSISGYINKMRLTQSEKLLRETEQNLSNIAEQSGFSSMGTFFRLFKKHYGRTPRDYQKEVKTLHTSKA